MDTIETPLRRREALRQDGWTDRKIAEAVTAGRLLRVRRGWYCEAAVWRSLWPEGRQRLLVHAVSADGWSPDTAASHTSAAAMWNLPFYRLSGARVHLTTPASGRISSDGGVLRHVAELPEDDIVEIAGVRCTSLARTVSDCARSLPLEAGLSIADAAVRAVAFTGQRYDESRAEEWIAAMDQRNITARHLRGIRSARCVNGFVDGRAQLPGESVSRLQLIRLGFARPRLQVPIERPGGRFFHVDLGLDDVRAFGEFDGKGKYVDAALRSGRTVEQVMLDEKTREDYIRGKTQWRFARWGDEHILSPAKLGARLATFGIVPPER